jgi:hypothetical protein
MKSKVSYVLAVFVLASMLLGACAGAPVTGASKVDAASVVYTGTIDSINGNQWIVNGQAITVDPAVIRDGPFKIGDTVKVEVNVNQDGTFTVTRVEVPSSADLSTLPSLGNDNSNVNSNDDNSNGNINDNANDDNSNANSNGNTNDDLGGNSNSSGSNGNGDNSNGNSNEVFGTVQALTSTSITIDGKTYDLSGSEIKGAIQVGDFVKLHLIQNADGTFSVRELELSDQSQVGNSNGNGNDDNGGSVNSNSNNGNDDNSNGSGSGNDNSNGSNSNDDNSSGGGNDHGGGNDNGGGGNSNG